MCPLEYFNAREPAGIASCRKIPNSNRVLLVNYGVSKG